MYKPNNNEKAPTRWREDRLAAGGVLLVVAAILLLLGNPYPLVAGGFAFVAVLSLLGSYQRRDLRYDVENWYNVVRGWYNFIPSLAIGILFYIL